MYCLARQITVLPIVCYFNTGFSTFSRFPSQFFNKSCEYFGLTAQYHELPDFVLRNTWFWADLTLSTESTEHFSVMPYTLNNWVIVVIVVVNFKTLCRLSRSSQDWVGGIKVKFNILIKLYQTSTAQTIIYCAVLIMYSIKLIFNVKILAKTYGE